ncbi:snare-like protein [Calocera viscosa TUFC12733]|uniref:Synaptobrevin homolog YKT6 n=1 Tax=Calocera viscosa (strain TUFC12733) TaxID=1330018 RepID=A0A167KA49_CALVF|nr:snare-like protein [Calocera viscosa TUFC12733]
MRIYSLAIFTAPPSGSATQLAAYADLSSYSFYQRGSVQEFLNFFSKTVVERTQSGQRQSVEEQSYKFNAYNRGGADNLAAIIITDLEYPARPAFSLLQKVLDDFSTQVPRASFTTPSSISFPTIKTYVEKYQDPRQADAIMKVQAELDETKIILHKTIESVLQRGEKLDNLVERSNNLSAQSKMFYKTAKKQNNCCVIA